MTRRGDVDDRVLTEAMLPVLHRLADVKDVRPLLRHRFNMPKYASSSVPPVVHVCVCMSSWAAEQYLAAYSHEPFSLLDTFTPCCPGIADKNAHFS